MLTRCLCKVHNKKSFSLTTRREEDKSIPLASEMLDIVFHLRACRAVKKFFVVDLSSGWGMKPELLLRAAV